MFSNNIKSIIASCLVGILVFSFLPAPGVRAADGDIKINKQVQSITGAEFVFDTGTISNYKPLKYIDNLDKYPMYYLEAKDITGDILFCNIIEGDSTVNTQMITTLAKMSYALNGSILTEYSETEVDEIYQALIWRELADTSREDKYQSVNNSVAVNDNLGKVFDLARTNIENQTDLIKQLNLTVDQERAVYDRKSSGYIYYGPCIVKCDKEVQLSINYSKAGALLVDRVGGEGLTKLKTGQNFYVRFDKDKSFTDFYVSFTGSTKDVDVVFLAANGSNKPNLVGVMPVNRQMKATLDFANINNKGTITVRKEPALAGFEYTVYTPEGTKIQSQTTTSDGTAVFNGMEMGSYVVKETKRPEYYTADEQEYPVELKNNGDNVVVNTSTVRQTAFVKINVLEDLSPVRGCIFNVKSTDSGNVDKTVRIDGQDTLELPLGSYEIKEVESNTMYELNTDTFPVVLGTEGSTEEITIPKVKATSFVEFKLPSGVSSVKVDIQDSRGNLLTTITLTGSQRIGLAPGSYTAVIKESGDWVPDTSSINFQVQANEISDVNFGFERASGVVTITTKYDGSIIADVEVAVKDVDENIVASLRTNTEGVATVKNLKPGTYMAEVVGTPTDRTYDKPSVPFIYEGINLPVVITLQEGAQQITNSTKDDDDRRNSSSSSSSSSQTTVENRYPTLDPDTGMTVTNPYPTLDPNGNPVNGSETTVQGTTTSSGKLPHTGLSDVIDYRLLIALAMAGLTYIFLGSFRIKKAPRS